MSDEFVVVEESRLVLEVSAPGPMGPAGAAGERRFSVPFHLPGTTTVGLKSPEFIAPVDIELLLMNGRANSGSGATYRAVVNGTTLATLSAATGTTVVTTTLSLEIDAGDRLQLEVVNAGTASDLSVTMWAQARI